MLPASALDADDEIYPLAYGMVNTDNEENLLWFLEHLKSFLMDHHVVLISNRNSSFLSVANKVFGSGYNAYCLSRLKESLDYFISSNLIGLLYVMCIIEKGRGMDCHLAVSCNSLSGG